MEVETEKINADRIQYDMVTTVQVLQVGKSGDERALPAGDICIEGRCSVGIMPETFTEFLSSSDSL